MSKPIQIIRNPFDGDQFFETEILAGQTEVLTSQKNSLIFFKKTYFHQQSSNNFFMTLKQQYTNFANLITKNAIVATVLMLLALTTVSASAAELFAPTEYKPSTLLQPKSSQVEKPAPVAQMPSYEVPDDWKTMNQYDFGYSFKTPSFLEDQNSKEESDFWIDSGENNDATGPLRPLLRVYSVDNFEDLQKDTCYDPNLEKDKQNPTYADNTRRAMEWKSTSIEMPNFSFFVSSESNYLPPIGECVLGRAYWTEIAMEGYTDGKGIVVFAVNKPIFEDTSEELVTFDNKKLSQQDMLTILASLKTSETKKDEVVNTPAPAPAPQRVVYTNPNIPNLKIDYTGWEMQSRENVNVENIGKAVLDLNFSKNVGNLKVTIVDPIATGFYPSEIYSAKKIGNNLMRLKYSTNDNSFDYRPAGSVIFANEDGNFASKCKEMLGSEIDSAANACGIVTILKINDYWVIANYTGPDSLLSEVDQMVLNSGIKFE